MRILHLVTRSHKRGAELAALELADELEHLGHRNRVFAMALADDSGEDPDLPPLSRRHTMGPASFLTSWWRMRRLLTEEPADVVIAHGGWACQVAALAARREGTLLAWQRILGLPVERWGTIGLRSWRFLVDRVDVGFALTTDLRTELRRLGFLGPVAVIPNARRPDRFAAVDRAREAAALRAEIGVGPDVPLIGLVGHLIGQKRPERAVEVLDHLRSDGREVHLVLAGAGPLRASVEDDIRRRGLERHASFLGYRSDVERVLAGLDILLLTSDAEGIPGIAIEALMVGSPLVTYPVGGVAEVIDHGVTGVILREPSTTEMAAEVAALLDDPDRRHAMGAEGRRRSPDFSAARTAVMYADFLGQCHRAMLASDGATLRHGRRKGVSWPRADPRTPNLFVVGVPKAGTTYMHQALRLGRDIHMSSVKEPGFFINEREFPRGLEYYLDAYFTRAETSSIRGESTPWYLYSALARERIGAINPHSAPKIIVFVRDPAARAWSMYRDQKRIGRETRSFEEAVARELADLERGELVDDLRQRYVWCGLYSEHITAWQEAFGHESVCVLEFEELVDDPEAVWAAIGRFLGRDIGSPPFDSIDESDRNLGGELRWPRLDRLIRSFENRPNPAVDGLKSILPAGAHRVLLQQLGRYNRSSGPPTAAIPDPATMARLDEFFTDEALRMAKVLGQPPRWSVRPPA